MTRVTLGMMAASCLTMRAAAAARSLARPQDSDNARINKDLRSSTSGGAGRTRRH